MTTAIIFFAIGYASSKFALPSKAWTWVKAKFGTI